jgi:hypothetical protein
VKFEDGFLCRNCFAGFVEEGSPVQGPPLVVAGGQPGTYVVRHRVRPSIRAILNIGLFFALAWILWRTMKPTYWPSVLSLVMVLMWCRYFALYQFGRVIVTADGAGLTLTETLRLRRSPGRLERDKIDGLWVRCERDGDGFTGYYDLMVDQNGTRSLVLIGHVARLRPLVSLAEGVAACLHVPSDTRGSDFA